MSCPSCGALNPESATFCGQCHAVFRAVAADHPPLESVAPEQSALRTELGSSDKNPTGPGARRDARVGRFMTSEGQTRWTCAVCESQHGLDTFVCDVCGAKMDTEIDAAGVTPTDWAAARRLERMWPGLGHIRTGQEGMGWARLGVSVLWVIGVVVLLVFGGVPGLLVALPLLFGIVAVWGTGPSDVTAAHSGRAPWLTARRFMYLVVGVTAGLIVMGGVAAIL